jgi:hypothetical protein
MVFLVFWGFSREVCGRADGLDVILTIDTSGSMKQTDPDNLRIEACKLFLTLLDSGNKVALVTFDASAATLGPMMALGQNRNELLTRLERVSSDGQHTDLYKAILHSSEILSESSQKRRAIVLMTDGRMDVGDPSTDRELSARLFDTLIPQLKGQEIQIFTVAFTKESDFDFLKRVSLRSGGFFHLAERDKDLHVTFTNIYDRLTVPDTLPVKGDEFYVDRSVREINVVVTKSDPEADVVLMLPDRRSETYPDHSADVQWYQSQAFEMITVAQPMPGPWRIRYGAEKGNKVFILTDLRLRSSFSKTVIPIETDTRIEVWLQQGPDADERDPLQIHDLRVTGEVEETEGVASPLRFVDDGTKGDKKAGDGVHTGLLRTSRHGEHRLRIRALGMTFEREREHGFYVPEKELVQADDLEEEDPQEESPTNAGPSEQGSGAAAKGDTEGTGWVWVFVKFSLINFVFLAAGITLVLHRQGKLPFRKKTDDH